MITYENECVDCDLPCRGETCSLRHVPHYICDDCGEDVEELYDTDEGEFCAQCVLEHLPKVSERGY